VKGIILALTKKYFNKILFTNVNDFSFWKEEKFYFASCVCQNRNAHYVYNIGLFIKFKFHPIISIIKFHSQFEEKIIVPNISTYIL